MQKLSPKELEEALTGWDEGFEEEVAAEYEGTETIIIKDMFKDPRFDPKEFKHALRRHGFKWKNAMRNQPCPCGSGKKTKIVAGTGYLSNAG